MDERAGTHRRMWIRGLERTDACGLEGWNTQAHVNERAGTHRRMWVRVEIH